MKKVFFLLIFLLFNFTVNASENIPAIHFYGDISNMIDKSDDRIIIVKYISDNVTFKSYAKLKLQGDSSLNYPKKNYNITFCEDKKCLQKKNVNLKWGEISKYTLKANWIDTTHSRNIVTAKIVSQMQREYGLFEDSINNALVDGFPIKVYLNEEFYGLYTLNLHKDSIFEFNNDNVLLVGAVRHSDVTNFSALATDLKSDFELEMGEDTDNNLQKLNRLLSFVINSTDEEFKRDFDNYLDLDSVLNYYCIMRFALLNDNMDNNVMLLTFDGSKWYLALYDLDSSWGLKWNGDLVRNYEDSMIFGRDESTLWTRFEQAFPDYIVVRYNELRESILTKENVMSQFSEFYDSIPSNDLNYDFKKWNISHDYQLSQIENFLDVRISVVDSSIELMKTDNYENVYNDLNNSNVVDKDENNNYIFIIFILLCFVVCIIFVIKKR